MCPCYSMPANTQVYLHYGPYEACGVVDHRPSRLQGLLSKNRCREQGYLINIAIGTVIII